MSGYNPLASQEIPHILWNQKVHYPVYSSAPHVLILSQTNVVLVMGLPPIVTSTPLGPNISLSTPFLNTFNLCSCLNVRDQVL